MIQQHAFTWRSASRTHVGMVRSINEDACLDQPEVGIFAVADGMGGHEAGDVASRMITEGLSAIEVPTHWPDLLEAARRKLQAVNQQLREESAQHYQSRTIGSTVVVLLAYEGQCVCLWVGDSRIYRLRSGQLQQLTTDHSHVQELINQGLLSAEEAHRHPLSNIITRAVGSTDDLEIDECVHALRGGDVFLLCSDGLNKTMADLEIARILAHSESPQEAVKALIHLALMRGANDNITTVVVSIDGPMPPDPATDVSVRNDIETQMNPK